MSRIRGNPDPDYFDFIEGTFHIGEARSGLLDSLTAAEKKELKAREANKTIGFAIPDGKDQKGRTRRHRSTS